MIWSFFGVRKWIVLREVEMISNHSQVIEDSHQFIRKLDASHVGSHHLVIPLRETEYLHSLASVFVSVVQYKESVRFFFKIQAMCLKSHTFREVLESHAMS